MNEFNGFYMPKQRSLAELAPKCKLIIWDEAAITTKEIIESFDILLKFYTLITYYLAVK